VAGRRKKIVGLVADVGIVGTRGQVESKAKIDTGASRTVVDSRIAARAGLGPIISSVRVRPSTGERARSRPLVQGSVIIAGVKFDILVSVVDRSRMKYPVLIGRDILKSGFFLIDPTKT